MNNPSRQACASSRFLASTRTVAADAYRGFYDITHNSLALLGTLLAVAVVVLGFRADLRASAEEQLLGWLLQRQEAASVDVLVASEPNAVDRVTAADLSALPEQQAKVTQWLSRKYRVAPEPLAALVTEAYAVGEKARLDPTLILAVMAVESRFNPFAQSPVGAQGLMQVLTKVHTDKYEDFGGQLAAFDPVSNLRVGVQVLQDAIRRAGSVEGGLRLYVGAVTSDGGWYIDRVLAEHARIQSVALGRPQPRNLPAAQPIPVKQTDGQPARSVPAADIEAVVPGVTPTPAAVIPS